MLGEYRDAARDYDKTTGLLPVHTMVSLVRKPTKDWLNTIDVIIEAFPEGVEEPVVSPTLTDSNTVAVHGREGMYALHIECAKKKPGVALVQKLLELFPSAAGVPGGARGCLPLHLALIGGRVDQKIVKTLTACYPRGAAEFDEVAGRLPLHYVCMSPRANAKVFEWLVKAYPEAISTSDELSGRLPLHWACKNPSSKLSLQFVRKILQTDQGKHGLRHLDSVGRIPVHYAARQKHGGDLIRLILEEDRECGIVSDECPYRTPH